MNHIKIKHKNCLNLLLEVLSQVLHLYSLYISSQNTPENRTFVRVHTFFISDLKIAFANCLLDTKELTSDSSRPPEDSANLFPAAALLSTLKVII